MGRMVNMHEGLIFVAILTATVLSGILGALLVVPVLASSIILVSYLLRKILGRPPFDDGSPDFQGKQPVMKHIFPVRHLKKVNRN
jgi:predicted PurR-regulated permease PerM